MIVHEQPEQEIQSVRRHLGLTYLGSAELTS